MELKGLTFEQLIGAVAVIVVLIGVYNVVMTAVKAHRDEVRIKSEPIVQVNKRLDDHEVWLAADKRRIEVLENQNKELIAHNEQQDKMSNISVRAQLAMLRHMQHGNNADGMRESEKEITDYLTGKE